MLDFLGKIC